ncbi:MAG: hypothetical protein QM785_18335 [Pyrinomonadaceae bacterium]
MLTARSVLLVRIAAARRGNLSVSNAGPDLSCVDLSKDRDRAISDRQRLVSLDDMIERFAADRGRCRFTLLHPNFVFACQLLTEPQHRRVLCSVQSPKQCACLFVCLLFVGFCLFHNLFSRDPEFHILLAISR